jgi:ATP-dependent DNA helicase UvrD/PcrA
MNFFADFHTHSRFSRATFKTLNPENLALWAQKKELIVVGTGVLYQPCAPD